jgi:hypothetical protein
LETAISGPRLIRAWKRRHWMALQEQLAENLR